MTATFTEKVPLSCLDDEEDRVASVTFTYLPGKDACGPAYDHGGLPAEPPEIEVTEVSYLDHAGEPTPLFLTEREEGRVVEWLFDNWEPPTGPDPDDERNRRRDEEMTNGG